MNSAGSSQSKRTDPEGDATWFFSGFDDLTVAEWYAIMKLRQEVFVVEQQCIYLDCDGKDLHAYHLGCRHGSEVSAYARILLPGISYPEVSIGRIATAGAFRGTGLGKRLMEKALGKISELFGPVPVKIGAQSHLVGFYRKYGFEPLSDFIEDGIPHTHMLRYGA